MKLLVLAHTPPPLHGQSVMVQAMLDRLPGRPGFAVHHVNFRLSDDSVDIGRWRAGKILRTIGFALQAIRTGLREKCETLYYVPTPPGKRGALYRDWLVMALCRPFFRQLVLHWHAAGLGQWLQSSAYGSERWVTRALLGRAALSIVLADSLRGDAELLDARRIVVVPNGIADPGAVPRRSRAAAEPWCGLFLGLCSEDKGVFAAAEAIIAANRRSGARDGAPQFVFVAAGPFPDPRSQARFQQLAQAHPGMIRHAGFVSGEDKERIFAACDCLLFPTHYSAEALPLVVLEAFARDRPVIATRWRALPDIVPPEAGALVPVGNSEALIEAILRLEKSPLTAGAGREHFLRHFTLEQHIERLVAALGSLEPTAAAVQPASSSAR